MANVYPVTPPFPTFRNVDGSALEAGFVYFGSPNTNPETNPISVYWDSAATIPAAQPVRTSGGFLSRNGTAANLFAAQDFSITVRNNKGGLVFTSPTNEGNSALIAYAATQVAANLSDTTDVAKGDALIGVKYPYSGGIARTQHQKNQDFVSIKDFNAIGDGVTDDTTAITAFFNSAISRPGIEHRLEAKTYAVSAVLPTINVSNVKIIGEGSDLHDIGPSVISGTVLKWIGTAGTTGPLVPISAISGVSNQRLANVVFAGIGIDCNIGTINYGLELKSIRDSDIDVTIVNAGFTGLNITVVGSLGEAKDVQRNRIYLKSRQVEKPNAFCLVAGGDSVANTSMNEFWVDMQHKDLQAIYLPNVDNNDWRFVRCYKIPGGAATECISLLGGVSGAERARGERFHFLTANLPAHVYGTSGSPSFAFASINHQIFCLDIENASPVPTIEVGGSIHWRKDQSELANDAWVSYTPTLGAQSGALTTASAQASYQRRGNIVQVKAQISITTNGTAAGFLTMSVPIPQVGAFGSAFVGGERGATGRALHGWLDGGGSSSIVLKFYDGTYPGGNGYTINLSGFYEVT